MRQKFKKLAYSFSEETVERPSPNEPPTAFRIWRHGENAFDGGVAYFTEESARLLVEEQAARNRPYAFDYSHLSLTSENPEAGKAAGWHRLEVRNGEDGKPELWAVDCQFTAPVASGMTAKVPEWRFYSPAFSVDVETNEIVGYTNCAITNNPLTHDLPMLASERISASEVTPEVVALLASENPLVAPERSGVTTLDPKQALAILLDPNASPEDKEAAAAVLAPLVADSAPSSEPVAASEQPAPQEEDKAASAHLAASYLHLSKKVEALETRDLLHGKALPTDIREWALTQPPAVVKSFLTAAKSFRPEPTAERNEKPSVGNVEATGFVAPPIGSSPVDKVLGLRAQTSTRPGLSREVDQVSLSRKINPMTPSQVRAARKAGQ